MCCLFLCGVIRVLIVLGVVLIGCVGVFGLQAAEVLVLADAALAVGVVDAPWGYDGLRVLCKRVQRHTGRGEREEE